MSKAYDEGREAGLDLLNQMNSMSTSDAFIEGIQDVFMDEHPTIQQKFVGGLLKLLHAHASREYTDLRNEASVSRARICMRALEQDGLERPWLLPYI